MAFDEEITSLINKLNYYCLLQNQEVVEFPLDLKRTIEVLKHSLELRRLELRLCAFMRDRPELVPSQGNSSAEKTLEWLEKAFPVATTPSC